MQYDGEKVKNVKVIDDDHIVASLENKSYQIVNINSGVIGSPTSWKPLAFLNGNTTFFKQKVEGAQYPCKIGLA
jgi:hypothetical protein